MTIETVAELRAIEGMAVRCFAAWHRPSERERADRIGEVRYLPWYRPLLYEAWLRLDRPSAETAAGPIDLVWAAAMVPPPTTAPLVASVHDLGFLDNPERSSRRGRSFFPRVWSKVADRADVIVCPSTTVVEDCVRHGIEPGRLRVVPLGVEEPRSSPEDGERVRTALGLPDRFALWVGTVEPRKNLPNLVAAIARLDDLHLAVVGPTGWDVDGADVMAPLGHRVHRLGAVDDEVLSGLYRAATVFVFPSLAEGFGLPVLEAMAHGTPVVTSAGTATEEVAGDAAVLVDPTDSASIAAGVSAVIADDATTMKLIERGRRRAAERSWRATAEGYASVFREVVGGS